MEGRKRDEKEGDLRKERKKEVRKETERNDGEKEGSEGVK